ncbi:SRPBCC family protein [Micromonospora maris]|uniref:SRPBCC family protein n=1 Tax=Micromonospora maris TaxID=1003110 RepID=UPI002E12C385|nr:SRPBCC family protein [Micromonospora maris]
MVRHDTFTISRHLDVPPGEVFTRVRRYRDQTGMVPASWQRSFIRARLPGGRRREASSTFTGLDTAPERLEYRSRYIDIADAHRIVYGYEAIVDGDLRWTSLVTVRLDPETDGTRLEWTEQVAFLKYTGDGSTDLAHLRGASVLRLNGLDAVLQSVRQRQQPR